MKKFRQIALTAALTVCAFTSVLYTGCKDKCGSTVCNNGGTCNGNDCICAVGYSDPSCNTAWDDKYIGTFTVTQSCTPSVGASTWESAITKDATNGGNTIDISNFANFGTDRIITASVDSINSFTITEDSTGIEGHGTVAVTTSPASTVITLHYSHYNVSGPTPPYCTMVFTKK